ncbi:hypothetical protein E0Z10_g2800 [Xylaria hypoxylon]|uniref:N-acetyltransferase domain-containing protein n=1 Tax=Xylaria hypoxylon TaxID=37992 RepID=A0A4Z0Z943_9PEZI|nr:hypothetical protein E0Z10_g2800 [Xylaria hypoxylon]
MPLVLQLATEADAERSAQIEKEAYAPNVFNSILFPGPFPEPTPGENPRVTELAKQLREDSSTRWLKIIDTDLDPTEDNKQMIGFAQWNINDGSELPAGPRSFGPGCNVEACEAVFGGLHGARLKYFGDRKHVPRELTGKMVELRLLHVDPKHQRRGVGKMLVMWGVEEAKKLGLPVFLQSSEDGHSLYLSCGFRDIGIHSVDSPLVSAWQVRADAVKRHVPLQGTASVPPGQKDFTGNVMDYEEGADLMREPDAAGGAYKRYDHVQYHPEDLKGKGEPSYTIERDLKKGKKRKD